MSQGTGWVRMGADEKGFSRWRLFFKILKESAYQHTCSNPIPYTLNCIQNLIPTQTLTTEANSELVNFELS